MTLAEIEALASSWRAVAPTDRHPSYIADDLAAIIRRLLPVVREALVVRGGNYAIATTLGYADRQLFDRLHVAVDELRFGKNGVEVGAVTR